MSYKDFTQMSVWQKALKYINKDNKESLVTGYREVIDELDSMIKSIENRKNP
jgi:hypothetical protein